jgi:hypothetical protein
VQSKIKTLPFLQRSWKREHDRSAAIARQGFTEHPHPEKQRRLTGIRLLRELRQKNRAGIETFTYGGDMHDLIGLPQEAEAFRSGKKEGGSENEKNKRYQILSQPRRHASARKLRQLPTATNYC